nr:MAG TPA: hypothetical protein [Caudoviricetes sp.]
MEDVKKILAEEIDALRKRIIANIQASGEVASGRTMDSLRVEANEQEGILWGRKAFGTLETGRKGGKIPAGFVLTLSEWIKNKRIPVSPMPYKRKPSEKWKPKYSPQERGYMSFAGALAHTIKTKGTSLYRSGGRSDIYSNEIPITIENISNRILKSFETEVEHININASK